VVVVALAGSAPEQHCQSRLAPNTQLLSVVVALAQTVLLLHRPEALPAAILYLARLLLLAAVGVVLLLQLLD
jgi:hypothetical protein